MENKIKQLQTAELVISYMSGGTQKFPNC